MKKLSTKGFTLIELLVVITIIGILATGATAVYTSAQQKARDSIRQNDILALRSATEQAFGDAAEYPETTVVWDSLVDEGYMQQIPSDPKSGQADDQTSFVYVYGVSKSSSNDVQGQEYEYSANFENSGNSISKEVTAADGGDDNERWEIGVGVETVCTAWDNTAGGGAAKACNPNTIVNDFNNDNNPEQPIVVDGLTS